MKIFVSGCYDVLHAGHLDFLRAARALGSHLTVCVASDDVYMRHKHRLASQPDASKVALLQSLRVVDDVVVGMGPKIGLDFEDHFRRLRPDILAVTEDDKYQKAKRALCRSVGAKYVKITGVKQQPLSTSGIVQRLRAPVQCSLRVDFAGGWLDLPRFAREDACIVNCAISPGVSLTDWPYQQNSGLGGSAAWACLNGRNPIAFEAGIGAGWQDAAAILETGLCVWRSGPYPALELKTAGRFLHGLMGLYWTGKRNAVVNISGKARDYATIAKAGWLARDAVRRDRLSSMANAMLISYSVQRREGMNSLPQSIRETAIAYKYCGGGFGGYALFLFSSEKLRDRACRREGMCAIEPYIQLHR